MQFFSILAMAIGLASAADICRTTGSGCSGNKVCCAGIVEGRCCNLGTAKDTLLWTLPDNSRFQVWSGTDCNKGNTGTFKNPNKVTDKCISFSYPVPSAKWLAGGGTKRAVDDDEPCAELNVAVYEVDGVEHTVHIPEGDAKVVESWMQDGQWEKLAKLE